MVTCIGIAAAIAAGGVPALAQVFIIDGRVVSVESGDQITVQNRRRVRNRVRLAGVSSPKAGQPFAAEAASYLSNLVLGKTVKVVGRRFDQAGLLKGKVLLNGRDINLEQVIAGFAWHHAEFPSEQSRRDRSLYEAAEAHAREHKFNLWSAHDPVPPWLFNEQPRVQ